MQRYVFFTNYARKVGSFVFIYYICNNINGIHYYPMNKESFLYKAYDLYADGFRNMRLGRTLWAIILIKLFIMFAILKVFFFPNFLKENAPEGQEPDYVATEMIERAAGH